MAARCGVPVLLHSQCSHEGGHALGSDRIGKFAACFEGGADDEAISDGQEVADVRQGHAAAKENFPFTRWLLSFSSELSWLPARKLSRRKAPLRWQGNCGNVSSRL